MQASFPLLSYFHPLSSHIMLAVSFVVFALLGHAISAPAFIPRDDSPSDTDLLLSCPGAAGNSSIFILLPPTNISHLTPKVHPTLKEQTHVL
jgi:hypothetical protein